MSGSRGRGRGVRNGAGRRAGVVVCRWAMGYCSWPWTSGLRLEPVLKEVDWFLVCVCGWGGGVGGQLPEATLTGFSLLTTSLGRASHVSEIKILSPNSSLDPETTHFTTDVMGPQWPPCHQIHRPCSNPTRSLTAFATCPPPPPSSLGFCDTISQFLQATSGPPSCLLAGFSSVT